MGTVRRFGKSSELSRLATEHYDEFVYEMHREGIRLHEIGSVWSIAEVFAIVALNMRSPESWLHVAEQGWRYPVSREWMLEADRHDQYGRSQMGKKWRDKYNYPRPWPKQGSKTAGKHTLSPKDARAVLDRARVGGLQFTRPGA